MNCSSIHPHTTVAFVELFQGRHCLLPRRLDNARSRKFEIDSLIYFMEQKVNNKEGWRNI